MNTRFLFSLVVVCCIDLTTQQGDSNVLDFTANKEHYITVDVQTNVTFRCTVTPGTPVEDVAIQGPDGNIRNFKKTDDSDDKKTVLWETRQMKCLDGGTFLCLELPVSTRQPQHPSVIVNVKCPIEFPENAPKSFKVSPDNPVFSVPFIGFPDPSYTDVTLYKVDGDQQISIAIFPVIKRNNFSAAGKLSIVVDEDNPELEGDYFLLAGNSEQQEHMARLDLHIGDAPPIETEVSEHHDLDKSVLTFIGISVGIVVTLALLLVILVSFCKHKKTRSKVQSRPV